MGREAAVMDWEQKFPFLREKGHVVSLIGGGGKTTLLYALSAYCTAKGWRVLTATTTHIRKPVNVPWIAVNEEEKTASLVGECQKRARSSLAAGDLCRSRNPSPTRKIDNSARSDSKRVDFGCRYHISGGGWREMSSV